MPAYNAEKTLKQTYEEIYRKPETEIIINATPVGMFPAEDETPLDIGKFPSLVGVFDCIYNPLRTNLVLAAKTRGINCGGGLMMLAAQGVQSEKIWGCFEGETESKISFSCTFYLFGAVIFRADDASAWRESDFYVFNRSSQRFHGRTVSFKKIMRGGKSVFQGIFQ